MNISAHYYNIFLPKKQENPIMTEVFNRIFKLHKKNYLDVIY